MAMRAAVLTSLAGCVAAHGGLVNPPAREQTVMYWFNEGCQIGCQECQGHVEVDWNQTATSICTQDMEPTLDPALHTYFSEHSPERFRYMPWNAPGHSPLFSPCGLAAGQSGYYPSNGDIPPPGYKPGFDGRNISGGPVTEWQIGSVQEVSWSIEANHGGGYAVRLCPLSSEQTEECFQKHHLSFEGDSTWIQFGPDPMNGRTLIRANRTTKGTKPRGSQWTKVPIPSCGGAAGGGLGCDDGCDAPQFESPIPGLWGNGPSNGCAGCDKSCGNNETCNREHCGSVMDFQIVENVKVPDLPVGDYSLSFRWDCEQTAQIWAQCANIKIVSQALI